MFFGGPNGRLFATEERGAWVAHVAGHEICDLSNTVTRGLIVQIGCPCEGSMSPVEPFEAFLARTAAAQPEDFVGELKAAGVRRGLTSETTVAEFKRMK